MEVAAATNTAGHIRCHYFIVTDGNIVYEVIYKFFTTSGIPFFFCRLKITCDGRPDRPADLL